MQKEQSINNEYPTFLGPEGRAEDFYKWLDRLHGRGKGAGRGDFEGAEILHELAFGDLDATSFLEQYAGPPVEPNSDLPVDSPEQSEAYQEYRQNFQTLLRRMESTARKLPSTREPGIKLNQALVAGLIDKWVEVEKEHGLYPPPVVSAKSRSKLGLPGLSHKERDAIRHRRDGVFKTPEGRILANTIIMLNEEILLAQTRLASMKVGKKADPTDIYRTAYEMAESSLETYDPNAGTTFSTYLTNWLQTALATRATKKNVSDRFFDEHGASLFAKKDHKDREGLLGTLGVEDEITIGVPDAVQARRLAALLDDPEALSERDRILLKMRFGLGEDGEKHTLKETGQALGVTRERVRQIEPRAYKHLKKAYEVRYGEVDHMDESIRIKPSLTPVQYGAAGFQTYRENAGTAEWKYQSERGRMSYDELQKKKRNRESVGHYTAEADKLNGKPHMTFDQLQQELPERFNWFLRHDELLTEPQRRVMVEDGEYIVAGHSSYPGKRPTGTGKSVSTIAKVLAANTLAGAEEPAWDVPTIVLAPRRYLAEDLYKKWTDPELYGLSPKHAGVYHSQIPIKERKAALKKPVLFTTYASFISMVKKGMIKPEYRPLIMLDEVHRTKGKAIKPAIQGFFDQAHIQGWTATDTFSDGKTIGYYLFGRENERGEIEEEKPFHVTTYKEAIVDNKEITPYKNIIVTSPAGEPDIHVYTDRDFNKAERERIAFAKGRDEAALRMYAEWEDPQTGLKLKDMDSIWYCEGIAHAHKIQKQLNEIFGEGHAKAVSGETEFNELLEAQKKHKEGQLPSLTNADLLLEGHDSKNTQLIVMLRPTRSPIVAVQPGGRGLRLDPENPGKLTYILTMIDKNMPDMRVFGEEAGGMFISPPGMHYTTNPKTPRNPVVPGSYPKLEELEIISDPQELEAFRQRRIEERAELSERRKEYGQYLRADQMAARLRRPAEKILAIYKDLKAAKDELGEDDMIISVHDLNIPKEYFKDDVPLRVHKSQLKQFREVIGVGESDIIPTNEVKPADFASPTYMAQAALGKHPNYNQREKTSEIYEKFAKAYRHDKTKEVYEVEGIQARNNQMGYFKTHANGHIRFFIHSDLAPQFTPILQSIKEAYMPNIQPISNDRSTSPHADILSMQSKKFDDSYREEFDATDDNSYLKSLGGRISYHQQVERGMSNHHLATAMKSNTGDTVDVDATLVHKWQTNQELPSHNAMEAMVQVLIMDNDKIADEDKNQATEEFYAAYERTKRAITNMKSGGVDIQELNAFTNKLFGLRQQVGLIDPQVFANAINNSAAMDFPEHENDQVNPLLITQVHGNDHVPSNGMMLSMVKAIDDHDPQNPIDDDDKKALYDLHAARAPKTVAKAKHQHDIPDHIVQLKTKLVAYFKDDEGMLLKDSEGIKAGNARICEKAGLATNITSRLLGSSIRLPSVMTDETLNKYHDKFAAYLNELGRSDKEISQFKQDLIALNDAVRKEKERQKQAARAN